MKSKRKLSYAVIHYDHECTIIKGHAMSVRITSYKVFHTFKKAKRYAKKIGGSAFIEKCYITGKYKGYCKYIHLKDIK